MFIFNLVGEKEIVSFGAQKTQALSYRRECTQYDWLFALLVDRRHQCAMMAKWIFLYPSLHVIDMKDAWFQQDVITHLMPQSIYCVELLMAVYLAEMVMLFGAKKLQFDTVGPFFVERC